MSETTEKAEKNKEKPIDELTAAELKILLGDALLTVADLSGRIAAADPADFSDIEAPPAIGETRTARDSPAVKRAMTSIDAAIGEITTVETVASLIGYIANRFGATL